MELWIRSQDKENLIQPTRLFIAFDKNIATWDRNIMIDLGNYATKERALEVLNEIEERIMLINTINLAKDRDSLIACKNALTEEKIKGLSYPYQMPKE